MKAQTQAKYDQIIRGCAARLWIGKTELDRHNWYIERVQALMAECTDAEDCEDLNSAMWQNSEGFEMTTDPDRRIADGIPDDN